MLYAVPYVSFHHEGSQRLSSCTAIVTWNANVSNTECFSENSHQKQQSQLTMLPWLHIPSRINATFLKNEFVIECKTCPLIGQFDQKASVNCVWSIHFPWIIFHWSQKRVQLWTKGKTSACLRAANDVGIIWFFSLSSVPSLMVIFCALPLSAVSFSSSLSSSFLSFHADISQICSETSRSVSASPICQPCF